MTRPTLMALALLALVRPSPAAQPQFWEIDEPSHFLEGDLEGLSVDTFGRVRLAPSTPVLHNPSYPYVWTLARDAKGSVYAGTGNDGKVLRLVGSEATLFFDAPELEVHALAVGGDGTVYVATSPDGKVYAVKPDGKDEVFFDPAEAYIWALSFDARGNLYVGTGGEGKVYRVTPDGKSETLLDGPESHIMALAVEGDRVYAGSSPSGVIYRMDAAGRKPVVLQDTLYREIKAIVLGTDGSVYAAAVEGSDKEDAPRPAPPAPVAVPMAPVTAEVTVTESFMGVIAPPSAATGGSGRTVESPRTGQTKGALLKLLPSGESETLWSSTDEMPYALLRVSDGVLLGTGNKGKLYRIGDDRTWTMITALPVQQLTALITAADGAFVMGTSNPGTLYGLGATPGAKGTFVSKVRDTDTVSTWGRLQWHAEVPAGTRVGFETRSGHTSAPDKTWSDWAAAGQDGRTITSERARFLQIRAVLEGPKGATPVLQSIRAAYLQRNLRPQVTSVTVHPPGEVFQKPLSMSGETEILGLDPVLSPSSDRAVATPTPMMPATTYSRKMYQKGLQTFSWKGEDANGDALAYDIEYRPLHDTRFRVLRRGWTESVLAWDTSTVPNGRYVVRIVARDTPGNPESLALFGDKESAPFEVDNTPPTVTVSLAARTVRATARDDSSLIRKAEYSIDGSRWEEIHPQDGINDSLEEAYEFTPRGLTPGPHVIVVRATDLLGNVSTAQASVD
jgi:outer membrane protein assembly factor BamB